MYFQNLLGHNSDYHLNFDDTVIDEGPVPSLVQKDHLLQEIFHIEVKNALWDIDDNKAASTDGYSASFFKRSWNVVGNDVIKAIKSILWSGFLRFEVNTIVLHLVPKGDCPSTPAKFRPISCCSTMYKIISKVLCIRVKPLLLFWSMKHNALLCKID